MGPVNAMNAMNAMNADYAQMTEAVHWQQQRIIELEAENRELRRQLDDMRRGVGIAVIIEGRQIPLAAPAAASTPHSSVSPAFDGPWTSAGHHVSPPTPSAVPTPLPQHTTPQRAFSAPPPVRATAHTAPPQPAQLPHRASLRHGEAAFSENSWLTGPAPAVKPAPQPPHPQRQQPAQPTPRQESRRVQPQQQPQQSPRYTPPGWLREEAPTVASWETEPEVAPLPAPPLRPRVPAQRHYLSHPPIPPVPAEIWRAEQQRDAGAFPTLAQITGQHPAVRIPGKRKKNDNTHGDEPNPFTDSFVLG